MGFVRHDPHKTFFTDKSGFSAARNEDSYVSFVRDRHEMKFYADQDVIVNWNKKVVSSPHHAGKVKKHCRRILSLIDVPLQNIHSLGGLVKSE